MTKVEDKQQTQLKRKLECAFSFKSWTKVKRDRTIKKEYWSYFPNIVQDSHKIYIKLKYEILYPILEYCKEKHYGQRLTCVFTNLMKNDVQKSNNQLKQTVSKIPLYKNENQYGGVNLDWSVSPTVQELKSFLQSKFNLTFDYCLLHYYSNGKANISWHADREALNTVVASVSFGATRTFLIRLIQNDIDRKVETEKYELGCGDVFIMNAKCQQLYEHSVATQSKIDEGRFNLTFRQFDKQDTTK